jgi:hypothetical protein
MEDQHLVAEVEPIEGDEPEGAEVAALMRSVVEQFENYSKLNRKLPAETAVQLGQIEEPRSSPIRSPPTSTSRSPTSRPCSPSSIRCAGWRWPSPSWRASSACSRSRRRSAAGSSARWRRPSANIISTSS